MGGASHGEGSVEAALVFPAPPLRQETFWGRWGHHAEGHNVEVQRSLFLEVSRLGELWRGWQQTRITLYSRA